MPNWSEQVDALTEREATAIEAEDWAEVNACLDKWKDLFLELRQALQSGDKEAETEIQVLFDVRRRHHPLIAEKCNEFGAMLEGVSI